MHKILVVECLPCCVDLLRKCDGLYLRFALCLENLSNHGQKLPCEGRFSVHETGRVWRIYAARPILVAFPAAADICLHFGLLGLVVILMCDFQVLLLLFLAPTAPQGGPCGPSFRRGPQFSPLGGLVGLSFGLALWARWNSKSGLS